MAQFRFIQDIVVNKRGNVDEFDNDGQRDMLVPDAAGYPARQKSQARTQPLGITPENIPDMIAQPKVKATNLTGQRLLDSG